MQRRPIPPLSSFQNLRDGWGAGISGSKEAWVVSPLPLDDALLLWHRPYSRRLISSALVSCHRCRIMLLPKPRESPSPMDLHNLPPELNFWWVNNKQTHAHEVGGNYIWSPITRSDGGKNIFYDNMLKVRPGDVVLAFAHAAIKAVGICTASAIRAPKPDEFGSKTPLRP